MTAYSYSIGQFTPNGNVQQATDSVMGQWSYNYDTLSRVRNGSSSSGPYSGLNIAWDYDSFGNRQHETLSGSSQQPVPASSWASYDTNNRISSASVPVAYDAAGNITDDGTNKYLYDREGRICAVWRYQQPASMTGYLYDAAGNRVARGTISSFSCNLSSNGFTSTVNYVVGLNGEQLDEINGSGQWLHTNVFANGQLLATYGANETFFALNDWLGTKRAEITPDGGLTTYGSLPFGNGLTTWGSLPDATEHHFTGKERDAESGNDYFGARYYASSMGRMLSPDPDTGTLIHIMNPQRWNMYAYALNNPLTMTDPTGKDAAAINFSGMVAGLGHEGILSINPDGTAEYARFGPAEQTASGGWGLDEPGQVQTSTALPTVQFGANGLPTDASMTALKDALAKIENVSPSTVRINYFKTTPQETANLNAWIAQQKANAGTYKLCTRNCANFTARGLVAGGALTQSQANKLSIHPNRMFQQLTLNCHTEQTTSTIYDSNGNAIGSSSGTSKTVCSF